jgi:hypothetical protein
MFFRRCISGTGFAGVIPIFLMLGWWRQSGVLATIALVLSWFAAIVGQVSAAQDFVLGLRLRGSQALIEVIRFTWSFRTLPDLGTVSRSSG